LVVGRQQPDLPHHGSDVIIILTARNFPVPQFQNAHAANAEFLPGLEHPLVSAAENPLEKSVSTLDGAADQLKFHVRRGLKLRGGEFAQLVRSMAYLPECDVLIGHIRSEYGN